MFFYWLSKIIFGIFAKTCLRLRVEGRGNLPAQGAFILAANHASSLDPFVIIAAVNRYIRWLVIHEYYDQPYFRWFLKKMRFIRIENNLPKEAFRALKYGQVIGIFPEGRRCWDGKLGPARPGATVLAERTAVPVVPVVVLGSFQALPRTKKWIKFSPVTVRIGTPVFFSKAENPAHQDIEQDNTKKLMQRLAELMY
ncbi:MAG: 1-acyl-sn-glycerol-3-phosphate acyltransferase [Candidatus Omnitrophica bacterium]|nr:1-acyl-sn-glycerol-3-phosphate acyltransferase [Candidatus Omnitrophota bacterium]